MKLSIVFLSCLVVLAVLLAVSEAKKPRGPCRVENCKKCIRSGKKCKKCNAGFELGKPIKRKKSKKCVAVLDTAVEDAAAEAAEVKAAEALAAAREAAAREAAAAAAREAAARDAAAAAAREAAAREAAAAAAREAAAREAAAAAAREAAAKYMKTSDGQLCSAAGRTQLTSQSDCQAAAASLGITWAHAWNGPNDFPGCLHANDGRDMAYWNLSPSPAGYANNPRYAAICGAASEDCQASGEAYSGTTAVTKSGKTCQNWAAQSPHSHTRGEGGGYMSYWNNRGESPAEALNYCRDPDGTGELWCYTTDSNKRWEACTVPTCA